MESAPETPIQSGSIEEDYISAKRGLYSNRADDEDVQEYIRKEVLPLMTAMVNERESANEEWQEIQKMSFLQHNPKRQKYLGQSNAYIPAYAKNVSTAVNQTSASLFPGNEFVQVVAMDETSNEHTEAIRAWVVNQFINQARLRQRFKPLLRQLKDFGTSVGKVWFSTPPTPKPKQSAQDAYAQALAAFKQGQTSKNAGLRFRAVSMFAWYMWPITVDRIEEAVLVMENIQVTKQFLVAKVNAGEWLEPHSMDGGTAGLEANSTRNAWLETLQNVIGAGGASIDENVTSDLGSQTWVQELYFRMKMPKESYLPEEDSDMPIAVQAYIIDGQPVLVRRNPYFFEHAPYVVKTDNERPNSFYGMGMGKLGLDLQSMINDLFNQTNDNGIFALNPMIVANPDMIVKAGTIRPGATWWTRDKDALSFVKPPMEQIQYGMQLSGQAMALMSDLQGTPQIVQGTSTRGAAKTATGAQILQRNAMTDINDGTLDIEGDVLIPLCNMAFALGCQYEDAERMVATAGKVIKVPREAWAGTYDYQWLASNQAANAQVRAQQAMQLLSFFINPAFLQLIASHGYTVNPLDMARRIFTDMGLRGFDKMLIQLTPPAQMAAQQAVLGGAGAGAVGAPVDSNAGASAVDQAILGQEGSEAVAGEGEDFAAVRDEADGLAALMGG